MPGSRLKVEPITAMNSPSNSSTTAIHHGHGTYSPPLLMAVSHELGTEPNSSSDASDVAQPKEITVRHLMDLLQVGWIIVISSEMVRANEGLRMIERVRMLTL